MTQSMLMFGLFGAVFAVAGCGESYRLDVYTEAHGASVDGPHLTLPVGNAVGVVPLEGDQPIDADRSVRVTSRTTFVVEVAATPDPGRFVLWGVTPGAGELEVVVDDDVVALITVDVLPRAQE